MGKKRRLQKITEEIKNCKICKIGKIGKAVPGEGNPDAKVMFVGEAPGKLEVETGRPFVGRSGKLLRSLIKEIGLKEEEAHSRFGFLLKAFQFGAPPHCGVAYGVDRLVAILSGLDSIRDTIAFPKTQRGNCPLTSAPSGVDEKQLKELGLVKVVGKDKV